MAQVPYLTGELLLYLMMGWAVLLAWDSRLRCGAKTADNNHEDVCNVSANGVYSGYTVGWFRWFRMPLGELRQLLIEINRDKLRGFKAWQPWDSCYFNQLWDDPKWWDSDWFKHVQGTREAFSPKKQVAPIPKTWQVAVHFISFYDVHYRDGVLSYSQVLKGSYNTCNPYPLLLQQLSCTKSVADLGMGHAIFGHSKMGYIHP